MKGTVERGVHTPLLRAHGAQLSLMQRREKPSDLLKLFVPQFPLVKLRPEPIVASLCVLLQ